MSALWTTTNVRSRTHLRRWKIADKLTATSPFGIDYPSDMVFETRMTGHEVPRFADAFNASPKRDARYPAHAQWVPQYTLERVMLERARAPGIEIRFGFEFRAAEQDEERVTSTIVGPDGVKRSDFVTPRKQKCHSVADRADFALEGHTSC